ncbi:hypothetical protein L7F22_014249 [Adiantum nelumboides]|nr:hypothetical protein [Adiantum nelumboides]
MLTTHELGASDEMLLPRCLVASLTRRSSSCSFERFSKPLVAEQKLLNVARSRSHNIRSTNPRLLFSQCGKTRRRVSLRCYSSASSSSAPLSFSFPTLDPSCFCSSVGSLVDLSEYLVNGCKWTEAPPCPDYVGPVSISRTPDGRGRGLYATCDVAAGDVLLISNAFAATYNDTDRVEMYFKIASIVKQSPRALHQYYALAGNDDHDSIEVPDVKLYDPSIPCEDGGEVHAAALAFDEARVIHIMNVNSFSGELKSAKTDPEMRLTGLWLLPSFINHSCIPNASRLIVGEAMFILAARNIRANEEITISYTDAMAPLKRREDNLGQTGYGFHCECKRCTLERSVQMDIEKFSDRYHVLYDKAGEEVYSAVTNTVVPSMGSCPACAELYGVYHTLARRVSALKGLSKLEKQWILGGYSCDFLGHWIISGYASQFSPVSNFVNSTALELIEAMKATEAGLMRTLSFTTVLTLVAEKEKEKYSHLELSPSIWPWMSASEYMGSKGLMLR